MNKKIISYLIISCLLIPTAVAVNAAPQEEETDHFMLNETPDFVVDDDADEDWYDLRHVKTINEAIERATYDNLIYVLSGRYYENLEIEKPLELKGQDKESTFIYGEIKVKSTSNVIIRSFTIENLKELDDDPIYLIEIVDSTNCQIKDNNIKNLHVWAPALYGLLYLDESSNNIIQSNNFKSIGHGIGSGAIPMVNSNENMIRNNIITNCDGGISIVDGSKNCIYQNTIISNYLGVVLSVYKGSGSENKLIANCIQNNELAGVLIDCDNTLIYCNNIFNNGYNSWLPFKNTWDLGINNQWYSDKLKKGNYYGSDYKGEDKRYPYGIGDDPHFIPATSFDYYPLMEVVDIYSIEI